MTNFDLFGSQRLSVSQVRDLLEGLLGVQFQLHDSDYLGEYYRAGDSALEHFVIHENDPNNDGELLEPEFRGYSTLVQVNRTTRSDELVERLTTVGHLDCLRRQSVAS